MKNRLRILTEASGSLTAGYLLQAIKDAGHVSVASDLDTHCFGRYLADEFLETPRATDTRFWERISTLLADRHIQVVIPSLDEVLLGWAERKASFRAKGIDIITSDPQAVALCQDKWLTYQFFRKHGIPTPATSLTQDYPLVKPRLGRGATGVEITAQPVNMDGMISQEVLEGTEYTVDVFCDLSATPIYIVPRRRLQVREGKSTAGLVEEHGDIAAWVRKICTCASFSGPINIQCFVRPDGTISFVEINPRIAGGMALGFAATENWIDLIVRNLINGEAIVPKPIAYGMEMKRYYAEIFIPAH